MFLDALLFCMICLLIHNSNQDINVLCLFAIHSFGSRLKINDFFENEGNKIRKINFVLAQICVQCAHLIRNGVPKFNHL
jgi:hypothetical protein